jgi:hypothetical protein
MSTNDSNNLLELNQLLTTLAATIEDDEKNVASSVEHGFPSEYRYLLDLPNIDDTTLRDYPVSSLLILAYLI